jgi:prolyl 4-hydroxylase
MFSDPNSNAFSSFITGETTTFHILLSWSLFSTSNLGFCTMMRRLLLALVVLSMALLRCQAREDQATPNSAQVSSASNDASLTGTCSAESLMDGTCKATEEQSPGDKVPVPFSRWCQDDHDSCTEWADSGECIKNPKYMYSKCRRSCQACDDDIQEPSPPKNDCHDEHENCEQWAHREKSECDANPKYMHTYCKRSCGVCPDQMQSGDDIARGIQFGELQVLSEWGNATEEKLALKLIQESMEYMAKVKAEGIVSPELYELCSNRHEKCTVWALMGECEANPPYMKKSCAPACKTCDNLDFSKRCPPLDPSTAQPAWEPGDLNKMFERLTQEPYWSQYQVKILSRDPWVITMENVIKEDEAERLIALGAKEGYQRSGGVGKVLADGSIEKNEFGGRTSTNAWCHKECAEDPKAVQVIERLSNITHIPSNNSESLQLLRYEPGQFYRRHHDYIADGRNRQPGVRILTMYLYLNDVEAGGGTKFNALNITVMPKQGRKLCTNLLFWFVGRL